MKQYVCSVCGYVYDEAKDGPWEMLSDDWKCPWCKAGKDAFREKGAAAEPTPVEKAEKPHVRKELSPMELSILCSNLARGCEKQYLPEQAAAFTQLSEFFRQESPQILSPDFQQLRQLIDADLNSGYVYAHQIADEAADRGAKRALVWSEKVTRMLQSLLSRYRTEGEAMLSGTGVYVCSVCGFVYVGDAPPEICPVCKVPAWKFEKAEGRGM